MESTDSDTNLTWGVVRIHLMTAQDIRTGKRLATSDLRTGTEQFQNKMRRTKRFSVFMGVGCTLVILWIASTLGPLLAELHKPDKLILAIMDVFLIALNYRAVLQSVAMHQSCDLSIRSAGEVIEACNQFGGRALRPVSPQISHESV